VVKILLGSRVDPPAALVRRFPDLAAVRFRRGGLPPRVAGWCLGQASVAAITLWRTVFLGDTTQFDPELLLHELRHVAQFESDRAFPIRYLWESLRRGYHRNRFEVDAREYAASRLRGAPDPNPLSH
jgi:hypothetical protein